VILSGRRINDGMGAYVAQRVVKLLARGDQPIHDARVGILGFTFKENVPDIRNSKVVDIYNELVAFGIDPLVHDPVADPVTVRQTYGVELRDLDDFTVMSALIVAVAHEDYASLAGPQLNDMLAMGGIVVDVRSRIDPTSLRSDLAYWSL
jgi:UDP-N-acetyl-D-galactosamine dehydrogenase